MRSNCYLIIKLHDYLTMMETCKWKSTLKDLYSEIIDEINRDMIMDDEQKYYCSLMTWKMYREILQDLKEVISDECN